MIFKFSEKKMTREQVQKFLDFFGPNGERWTQGCYARDVNGKSVSLGSPSIHSACLAGARVILFGYSLRLTEIPEIKKSGMSSSTWNDYPGRTFEDVKRALLESIAD